MFPRRFVVESMPALIDLSFMLLSYFQGAASRSRF